jgi:hypothetical protein
MMRLAFAITLILPLVACATAPGLSSRNEPAKANPATIATTPAAYDGHEVEIVGLLVWQFENLGLYQSYGAYCRGGEKVAIAVDWHNWPGVTKADNRRLVMVRGTFRNLYGTARPNGEIVISNGARGPGPLEPGSVVRWLSAPKQPCPKALP